MSKKSGLLKNDVATAGDRKPDTDGVKGVGTLRTVASHGPGSSEEPCEYKVDHTALIFVETEKSTTLEQK